MLQTVNHQEIQIKTTVHTRMTKILKNWQYQVLGGIWRSGTLIQAYRVSGRHVSFWQTVD